jgi:hypothetical protein
MLIQNLETKNCITLQIYVYNFETKQSVFFTSLFLLSVIVIYDNYEAKIRFVSK